MCAGTQDVKSRKMPETLLGGPACLESGLKMWISRVAEVEIRIEMNERRPNKMSETIGKNIG